MKISFDDENEITERVYDFEKKRYIDLSTGLVIDINNGIIVSRLGKKDVKVLSMLIINNGRLTTRKQLMEHAWCGRIVTDNVLNVAISNIRKLLINFYPESQEIIKTINGLGYFLNIDNSAFDFSYKN